MKKFKALAVIAAACMAVTVPLAACNNVKNDETVLNVVALNRGYGDGWIKTIAQKFEEDHPGYKVKLDAVSEAPTLIKQHINSKNNIDDLYISVGTDWKSYAAQGFFAELDDLLGEKVDNITFKDKINDEFAQSVYYPNASGELHTYRLPWTAGVGGIFYNAKMFEENGWEVPATFAELKELCDEIVKAEVPVPGSSGIRAETVKPLIYTGQNTDYFDYTVYTWWAQLSGVDAVKDFMKYESPDSFSAQANPVYANLKKATQMWYDLFGNADYMPANCLGASNYDAQRDFANGHAAMMFNGDWIYNEILNFELNNSEFFELAIMPTPAAEGAVATDVLYTIGEDQYIAIPATSIKKDLAKDFIKLMVSDWGCGVFANQAHGLLAYKNSLTNADISDKFMQNLIEIKKAGTSSFTDYPPIDKIQNVRNSTAMMYLANTLNGGIWGSAAMRPFLSLLGANAPTIDKAFENIAGNVATNWATWKSGAGIA